jgi:hypothetical protein
MLASDRCKICVTLSRSFHGRNFEACVALYEQSEFFRKEWAEAAKNLGAEGHEWDMNVGVHIMQRTGSVLEMIYWFMTVQEFTAKFKLAPKAMNYRVMSMTDEFGQKKISGSLVKPSPEDPPYAYRRCRLFSETVWFLDEELVNPMKRLRAKQPMDTFIRLNDQQAKANKDHIHLQNRTRPS